MEQPNKRVDMGTVLGTIFNSESKNRHVEFLDGEGSVRCV